MKIEVLGSGSKGNCYLLHTSSGIIILEAGIKWNAVLHALNFDISNVLCCMISHEHGDHAKYISDYSVAVPVCFMSYGTSEALKQRIGLNNIQLIKSELNVYIGGSIWVYPFSTQHDASEPLGFLIYDTETSEKLVFATDTYYVEYTFPSVDYIMVECNYAEDILQDNIEKGIISGTRVNRLHKSHFELSRVKEFIKANDTGNLKQVLLIHLSNQNSDIERYLQEVGAITLADVKVADKGLKVDLGGYIWDQLL